MEMFGMFGGDLAKVFDLDKINLQKKQEFVQLVFLRMRELLQQREGFCLPVYEKSYIEQRHNIVSNLIFTNLVYILRVFLSQPFQGIEFESFLEKNGIKHHRI